jgi:hypothetical protein
VPSVLAAAERRVEPDAATDVDATRSGLTARRSMAIDVLRGIALVLTAVAEILRRRHVMIRL